MVESPEEIAARTADAQEQNADVAAMNAIGEARAKLENNTARQFAYSQPVTTDNKFAQHFSQDRVLTNLPKKIPEDFEMMMDYLKQYDSLIAHLEWMGFPEAKRFFMTHQQSILLSFRGFQGFERLMQESTRAELVKTKQEGASSPMFKE